MLNASVDRKIIVPILTMMLLLVYGAGISYGQVASHKHDGFYLRLATGVGNTKSTIEVEGTKLSFGGLSSNTTLGIGYAVAENLMIHLDIFGSVVADPKVEVDGKEEGEADAEVTISNLGIGATRYFMPANVYSTISIGLASGTWEWEPEGEKLETETGYGTNVALGKEWWVSDNWGIGVAGQWIRTVIPDKDKTTGEKSDLKTNSFGILLTATYN